MTSAFVELHRWSEPGDDEVYVLAMSRGTFTVRTLAGLLTERGLVDRRVYRTEAGLRRMVKAAYARRPACASADGGRSVRGFRAILRGTRALPLGRRAKALGSYVLSRLGAARELPEAGLRSAAVADAGARGRARSGAAARGGASAASRDADGSGRACGRAARD